jgi:hypothetical protein
MCPPTVTDVGRAKMSRRHLEQLRECVKAQMRWALAHGGDQKLLDLLRIESDRLSVMIGHCPALSIGSAEPPQVLTPSSFGRRPASHPVSLPSDV